MNSTSYYVDKDHIKTNAIMHINNMHPDKKFTVVIKDKIDPLTTRQRNYFHSLLDIISKYTGETIEYLKTRMCYALNLTYEVTLKSGEIITQRMSTEQLDKIGYSGLIDAAQEACQIMGLQYPQPSHFGG